MTEVKSRYDGLDGLRTFSCMGIVAMHVRRNISYDVKGFFFNEFVVSLTNLSFLFMAISAFAMCCGYYSKIINQELDVVSFYRKRYIRILPFFAFLSILDFVMNPSVNVLFEVFANCTLCFGLIPNAGISVIGVGWFLGLLFVFYIMFPFFCYLLSTPKRAWVAFVAAFIMNFACIKYFNADRTSIAYSFVFFMTGGLLFRYKDRLIQIRGIKWFSLCMAILFAFIYFQISGNTLVLLLITTALLLYAITVDCKGVLNNKMTKAVGAISFEVYLSHMMIFRMAEKAHLLAITKNSYVNYFVAFVLVFTGTCIFSILIKNCLKWCLNVLNKEKKCLT